MSEQIKEMQCRLQDALEYASALLDSIPDDARDELWGDTSDFVADGLEIIERLPDICYQAMQIEMQRLQQLQQQPTYTTNSQLYPVTSVGNTWGY